MHVLKKTVKSLLDENFIYARALHYLGVDFFRYEDATLEQICTERHIDHQRLVRSFYRFDTKSRIPFSEINEYPLPLVVAYLRYAHQCYIKEGLPFVVRLLSLLETRQQALRDLIDIFPLFVEDFIRHIYHEEDELFGYIDRLYRLKNDGYRSAAQFLLGPRLSLEKTRDHHLAEDEMAGLREMIEAIRIDSLHTQVIIQEIQAFDRELLYHAAIENDILFPKAMQLEAEILRQIDTIASLN